jgi:hypothetical protein
MPPLSIGKSRARVASAAFPSDSGSGEAISASSCQSASCGAQPGELPPFGVRLSGRTGPDDAGGPRLSAVPSGGVAARRPSVSHGAALAPGRGVSGRRFAPFPPDKIGTGADFTAGGWSNYSCAGKVSFARDARSCGESPRRSAGGDNQARRPRRATQSHHKAIY